MEQIKNSKPEEAAKVPGHQEDIQLLAAFQSIFGVVPRFGGAILGIVAIGYFVGWKTASSYYAAFGAEWVTSLLSPSELLQRSYSALSGIVSGVLVTMLYTVKGSWSKKSIQWADLITSVLAVILVTVSLGLTGHIGLVRAAYFSMAASFVLPFSLSFSLAQHAFSIRDREGRTGSRTLEFGYFLWLFAALQLPMVSGQPLGELAADAETSRLPLVTVAGESWRLLLAHEDRLVVVKLERNKRPVIRIVATEKVDRIQEYSQEAEQNHQPATLPTQTAARRIDGSVDGP